MNRLQTRIYTPCDLAIRSAEGEGGPSRIIEGYAILFDTDSVPMVDEPTRLVVERFAQGSVDLSLLNRSDIILNINHDNSRVLARSVNGEGTLSYSVDAHGVRFRAELPDTADGDTILELIRRRDIRGCSFAFTTDYDDAACVTVTRREANGRTEWTVEHRHVLGIYDFSVVTHPRYAETEVHARSLEALTAEADAGGGVDEGRRAESRALRARVRRRLMLIED